MRLTAKDSFNDNDTTNKQQLCDNTTNNNDDNNKNFSENKKRANTTKLETSYNNIDYKEKFCGKKDRF